IRQETTKGSATDVIYRVPDFVGNLYGTPERKDRRYGAGGRLLEDAECIYHYDDEGNLVFREFRQPREDVVRHDRRQMEREYGIRRPVTDMGWIYEWTSGGMLRRVVRPDGRSVEFRYDALGRRTAKQYLGKVTRWVWDGNTPLHEWVAAVTDNDGREEVSCPDGNSLTTWVFEEGTFVPAAKIRGDRQCSIVSDYMGTPVQMYDSEGNKIWDCTLDIYGKVADFRGESLHDCPFRFQGQYEDIETGLYYNRFRYYDPSVGLYISQDPIGLQGSMQLYAYVHTPNSWIDSLGLKKYIVYQAPVLDANGKPTGKVYTGRTSGADDMTRQQILNRRKSNHHRKDIGQLVAIFETNNYKTVRGAEHYYIEEARKTGEAADQIAGISDRNFGKNGKKLKGDEYMEAFFKEKSDLKQPKSSELSIYH
uniref:RHS repeat-associated core domain-containing protein n=1 Tax=Phocaeicola dorei TaxID=357276 RepID=UPI003218FE7E